MSELSRKIRLRQKLQEIHDLQETLLSDGVDGIEKYVEDVEGDWLENWDDNTTKTNDRSVSELIKPE